MARVTAYAIKNALSKKHELRKDFFILECKNGPTQFGEHLRLDAIAIVKSWTQPTFIGYEIKVSRSDFLSDTKWQCYMPYVHEFSFVCPSGLIDKDELDLNVGLIWYNPETGSLSTRRKAVHRIIEPDPAMLLYIIMNRIDSDRMPFETSKADMFRAWLEEKESTRSISCRVRGKLVQENTQLIEELNKLKHVKDGSDVLREIKRVLSKHQVDWRGKAIAEALDEELSARYPSALKEINRDAERLLKTIHGFIAPEGDQGNA
jgi:hypothetical protein